MEFMERTAALPEEWELHAAAFSATDTTQGALLQDRTSRLVSVPNGAQ